MEGSPVLCCLMADKLHYLGLTVQLMRASSASIVLMHHTLKLCHITHMETYIFFFQVFLKQSTFFSLREKLGSEGCSRCLKGWVCLCGQR